MNTLISEDEMRGLHNPGSLCYMISVIVQLFMIPSFVDQLSNLPDVEAQQNETAFAALAAVFTYLSFATNSQSGLLCLFKLLSGQDEISIFHQQDACDFLSNLLQRLFKEYNFPFLSDLFTGKLVNILTSEDDNNKVKILSERFFYISLSVGAEKNCDTLEKSLNSYTTTSNVQFCWPDSAGSPNVSHRTTRTTLFSTLPQCIIFHLRRFRYDARRRRKVKILDHFVFPELLDMSPYIAPAERGCEEGGANLYRLSGCVVHKGKSAHQGHYYSVVRRRAPASSAAASAASSRAEGGESRWFLFDDERVSPFDFARDGAAELFGGGDWDSEDDSEEESSSGSDSESDEESSSDSEEEDVDVDVDSSDHNSGSDGSAGSITGEAGSGGRLIDVEDGPTCDSCSDADSAEQEQDDESRECSSSAESGLPRRRSPRCAFLLFYDRVEPHQPTT